MPPVVYYNAFIYKQGYKKDACVSISQNFAKLENEQKQK